MSGCNAQAAPMPSHRTAPHGQPLSRAARRLPVDGHRRPATERCAHHSSCVTGAAQVAAQISPQISPQISATGGAPLWRTMMERWLAAAP